MMNEVKNSKGQVIGLKYKKRNGDWITYGYAQVKAFWKIYLNRSIEKPNSANVAKGLKKWETAMSKFNEGRRELKRQTITL